MNNKYFTPEIEDIRVGYECETKSCEEDTCGWVKYTFTKAGQVFGASVYGMDKYRVPYLTKEQIEAEGWKFEEYGINSGLPWFSKDIIYIDGIKRNIELRYDFDSNILDLSYDCGDFMNLGIFHGECKDINTFRYITKLLNI